MALPVRRLAVLAVLAGLRSSVGLQQGRDPPKLPKTEVLEAQASKTKVPRTHTSKTQASKTDAPKTEVLKTPRASKTEVPKTQASKAEVPKAETFKTEVPKTLASKTEVHRARAFKTEAEAEAAFQTEVHRARASKTEVPKAQASKTEVPKTHASKTQASKSEVLEAQVVQSSQAFKSEVLKTQTSKAEVPKTRASKTQTSNTEVLKTQVSTRGPIPVQYQYRDAEAQYQSSQTSESEVLKTQASKIEVPKTHASKTKVRKPHASRTHASKTEVPKTQDFQSSQASKTQTPKTEVPKTQASKTAVPKTHASKTQAFKSEVPATQGVQSSQASKSEMLKTQTSKTEVPKTWASKTQTSNTEVPEILGVQSSQTSRCESESECESEVLKTQTSNTEMRKTQVSKALASQTEVPKTQGVRPSQASKTEALKTDVPPRAMLTGQRLNSSNPLSTTPLPAEVKGSLVAGETNLSSDERIRRIRAARRLRTRDDQADQRPRFVAWLISGQVSRFIYKEATGFIDGGLQAWSGCFGKDGDSCSMSVDVHIALANTHVHQFRGPKYALPNYEDGAFEESTIEAHYMKFQASGSRQIVSSSEMGEKVALIKDAFKKSGARRVHVKIVSGEQFESNVKRVRELILKRARRSMDPPMKDFDSFWKALKNHENRFEQNGNMMYLRHLAYRSAVLAERGLPYNYTHILYTREDNVFVHPSYTLLQLARDLDGPFAPSESPASVLVDLRCGWLAFSDKLYFASRRGIDILFARTLDEHITQMAKWINMARTSPVWKDPLMTEDYFKRLLVDAHANVTKFDFLRTEVRYRTGNPDPCIPDIYRKCTSVGEQFETCPSDGLPR